MKKLTLTKAQREELNFLGSSLVNKSHCDAVDRALVICDHYAGNDQLTKAHKALHAEMLAETETAK